MVSRIASHGLRVAHFPLCVPGAIPALHSQEPPSYLSSAALPEVPGLLYWKTRPGSPWGGLEKPWGLGQGAIPSP